MKMVKENVTFRMPIELKQVLTAVAEQEHRSFSSQLNLALEEWLQVKNELHPWFLKDIKDSLDSGKPEPVWKG